MDPNATLAQLRELVAEVQACEADNFADQTEAAQNFSELFSALDGWITTGGALPTIWKGVDCVLCKARSLHGSQLCRSCMDDVCEEQERREREGGA